MPSSGVSTTRPILSRERGAAPRTHCLRRATRNRSTGDLQVGHRAGAQYRAASTATRWRREHLKTYRGSAIGGER